MWDDPVREQYSHELAGNSLVVCLNRDLLPRLPTLVSEGGHAGRVVTRNCGAARGFHEVAVGKTSDGPTAIKRPVFCLFGQGKSAASNIGKSPNSVRVPPRELGTVTNAKVGRINCGIGSKVLGGMRGINGRTII
jgi:hypothetical protein